MSEGADEARSPDEPIPDGAVIDELAQVFGPEDSAGGSAASAGDDPDDSADRSATSAGDDPDDSAEERPRAVGGDERDGATGDEADGGARVLFDPGLYPPPSPSSRAPHEGPAGGAGSTGVDDGAREAPAGQTIQIGGDELPDVAYLDDELERAGKDGASGPVVIEDDDVGDAIVASEATGRGIDTRIRQRRILVRRAEGRRRLRGMVIAAGVVVALIAVLAVLASSLFAINQITVVGNRYADPEALREVIVELDGTPALLADTTKFEEQLEAIPWVDDARVRVSFPNSASIEIRERTPVAAMPGADGLTRVLDKEGRVLDLIEGQPIALVWISGPVTLDAAAGAFAPPGPSWASALVPKLTPGIRPRVDSMQVTPDGSDLRVYLRPASAEAAGTGEAGDETEAAPATDPPSGQSTPYVGPLIEVRFGSAIGDNAQIEKLVRLERVLADIETNLVSVIDVSTPEVTVL